MPWYNWLSRIQISVVWMDLVELFNLFYWLDQLNQLIFFADFDKWKIVRTSFKGLLKDRWILSPMDDESVKSFLEKRFGSSPEVLKPVICVYLWNFRFLIETIEIIEISGIQQENKVRISSNTILVWINFYSPLVKKENILIHCVHSWLLKHVKLFWRMIIFTDYGICRVDV